MSAILRKQQSSGKYLYAVAYEVYRRGVLVRGDIEYLHAEDTLHAGNQFKLAHPNRNTHHIVGVAPAIGFFVEDNHGEVLST